MPQPTEIELFYDLASSYSYLALARIDELYWGRDRFDLLAWRLERDR